MISDYYLDLGDMHHIGTPRFQPLFWTSHKSGCDERVAPGDKHRVTFDPPNTNAASTVVDAKVRKGISDAKTDQIACMLI